MEERPQSLRRSAPRPAPSEGVDPIETVPAASTIALPVVTPSSPPVESPRRPEVGGGYDASRVSFAQPSTRILDTRNRARPDREREAVVQLNSKVSVDARETLERIRNVDGRTIRSGLEASIYVLDHLLTLQREGREPSLDELLQIYRGEV